jgi:asparagine synthase (glutamine-hydrolysing)
LKKHAEESVADAMMAKASERFPEKTPSTKEEYFYRDIFESHFTNPDAVQTVPFRPSIACSTPTSFR